ncbi:hypothetical protein EHB58_09450 [Salmonella enterica subsp. enterica serovar Hull]|uniref:Uncharacterized protein n=1 Tax=Salmonella enterica subsp. enterica serovar Hull TaxID=1403564 RepID=A0A5X4PDZ6_SALET|nr:hypothetical protein [Salmonella enterica]EBZ7585851.1 hypothetical protein [Salmonella enterica subsp. enterica serovar Hull]ECF2938604.1 hypothetical protein [Salmonella enterica subsp. enterica serovar Reading]ECN6005584.1 hypothetical protein [Salmonella enterica subsp. enterica serovar Brandenburg]EDU6784091.1 hypothetical protein [Salmonella enterica subsp. enterica serovar Gaminara]
MTAIIPFKPDGREPFQFTVSVGGVTLFATVPYNLYSNRYFLKLTDGQGSVVSYVPLIGSPDNYDINLALAYAPGSLIFRESRNQFEAE